MRPRPRSPRECPHAEGIAPRRRRARRPRIGLLSGVVVLGWGAMGVGCTYDFSIASRRSDAGPDRSDAGPDAELPRDARADGDGDAPSPPSCTTLLARVKSARAGAKACTSRPGVCTTSIKDECGCTTFVAEPGSAATTEYMDAIRRLLEAGCPASCASSGASCPSPPSSLCLVGPEFVTVCTP